jgi:hypothetical protein
MITQEQSREYTRCTRLNQFLDQNETVYNSFEPFADEVTDFDTNLASFTSLIPGKNGDNTGITTGKTALKHSIADALGLICRKTYSYALINNNQQLAAQVNTRPDKIFKMRDADVLGYVTETGELIAPLLTDTNYMKYGVTAAQLTDIVANATAFNGMIGKADVANSDNAVANAAIDTIIDALRLNIKHMDLLVDEFEAGNPGFVHGYHINSEVGNAGIRHSGIDGYVRTGGTNGTPVAGATVTLQNTTKSAVTDLNGYYHLDRVTPDDYMVVCSANGYAQQSKLHHVSRGKIDEMNWEMVGV